jgi:hypothetical protein
MEASARLTPNSAWTAGNTTEMAYMLLLPKVTKPKTVSKRHAAKRESIKSAEA